MFGLPCVNRDLKPIAFHPYTSRVLNRVLEIECGHSEELAQAYSALEKELIDLFTRKGIKAWRDNKIVFEFDNKGTSVFYGFYDWKFSIGLDYHDENEKHHGETMAASKKVTSLMTTVSDLNHRNFVYPEMIANGFVYAEEVEEAIITYLQKRGFDVEELRGISYEFEDPDTGRGVTTKVLKIRIA